MKKSNNISKKDKNEYFYNIGLIKNSNEEWKNFKEINGEDLSSIIRYIVLNDDVKLIEIDESELNSKNPNHLIYSKIYSKITSFDKDKFEKTIDSQIDAFKEDIKNVS